MREKESKKVKKNGVLVRGNEKTNSGGGRKDGKEGKRGGTFRTEKIRGEKKKP